VLRLLTEMKIWRLLLQTVGALNLVLSAVGFYALTTTALAISRHPHTNPKEPFFYAAYWTMSGIDAALLLAVVYVSIMLIKLHPRAAVTHTCIVAALFVYAFTPGLLWLLPHGVGTSIAGASGVGNMGVGVLLFIPVPYLYLLLSVLCVNIAQLRLKRAASYAPSDIRHV
jgi:hypothetical protein